MNIINRIRSSSQNSKIIIKNTLGALTVKGASLIISVLTTPAFIHYFNNNEVLGVWFTMLSLLIWFLNFDLGIGNGIRNQLVRDIASKNNESARATLSSGFVSVGVVTLILSMIGVGLLCLSNLNNMFNVDVTLLSGRTLLISSVAIFVAIMLRFFLTTVTSVFYALQKSAINNFLALCVSILQLLYVVFFHFENVEDALINLSVIYILLSNLPVMIAGVYVFAKPLKACRPRLSAVTIDRTRDILGIGAMFFICQLLYMCIANTNEFLITKLFNATYTAEYSFYHKVMSILSMVVTLAFTPVWSVVTKAVAEKDYDWLSKLYRKIQIAGVIVFIAQFLIVPFMQFILDIWLGNDMVNVELWTSISFACFTGCFVYSGMLSTVANGMARLKVQTICFAIGVVAKFVIDIGLYQVINHWSIVVWSNVVAFLPYIIFQQIDLNKFFKAKINVCK